MFSLRKYNRIFTKNLRKYFSLDFLDQALSLFKILCTDSGSPVNYKRISKDINLSEEKIAQHFKTFEKASLVQTLQRFDTKLRKIIKAHPKVYGASPCLVFAYLNHSSIPPGSLIRHVVEGYVFSRLKQFYSSEEVHFTNPTRNTEIDFFIPGEKILGESKYQEDIQNSLLEELHEQAKRFSLKPILFSKNHWGNANVTGIPVMFL